MFAACQGALRTVGMSGCLPVGQSGCVAGIDGGT